MPTRVRHGTGSGTLRSKTTARLLSRLQRIDADIMEGLSTRDELHESAHAPEMSAQIRFDELSLVVGDLFGGWLILVTPPAAGWDGTTLVSR